MKLIFLVGMTLLLAGCGDHLIPQEAIKACIDKGWVAYYVDSGSVTFKCIPPGEQK